MPNILLGVSSGIAIYKVVDLVSKIRKRGWDLRILMTPNASKLISPVVFSAVGNCDVYTDTYEIEKGWIIHTELSKWADILVVAPATANTIAKLANGFADNILTTTALAYSKTSKMIVPTMNTRMYENSLTVENIEKLKNLGWTVVEPEEGALACGDVGKGRYPENEKIIEAINIVFEKKILAGKKILITAGPTQEAIDPVRYISNHSSGKMGYSIAKVAKRLGAEVLLISGPVCLTPPYFIDKVVNIISAEEMFEKVVENYKYYDVLIMCAAVADYKPKDVSKTKIKKSSDELSIELVKNVDILEYLGKNKLSHQYLVGFAAETDNFVDNAKQKLTKKNSDMIVLNDANFAMGSDYNKVTFVTSSNMVEAKGTKEEVAQELFKQICEKIK